MTYDCETNRVAGTTLVTVRVRNEAAVPRRMRVRNDLPGPVLPPRREGVPERGWDEDGFTGVVPAADERSLGYACPAEDAPDSPVSVEWLGRADGEEPTADPEREAVRTLGRARPPADAVPTPTLGDGGATTDSPDGAGRAPAGAREPCGGTRSRDESTPCDDGVSSPGGNPASAAAEIEASPRADAAGIDASARPEAVESWLSAVETRLERAETLTGATAAEAAAVLETAGCVGHLPDAVAADEAALRAFADRMTRLAERAADTDPRPVTDALGEL